MISKFPRFRKKKTGSLFFIIFSGVLVAVFVIFLVTLNLKINQGRAKLELEIESSKQELYGEQAKREELLFRISQAQTEEYLEKVARQELNLQKEEEKVVTFVIEEMELEQEKEEEKSFLQKFFEIFKIRRD